MVASRTRILPPEVQKRVDELIAQSNLAAAKAKEESDAAREAAAEASIYSALSMLIGALIACAAAALGGRRRDEHL